ncbi:MAG: hypothetical protein AAF749_12565, partial [Pseudomonadota bacterium]
AAQPSTEKSFGATPYIVEIDGGCALVDSPRYNSKLAKIIEERFGAPKLMLLTHVDDVGEHDKWHARFPEMQRVIHEFEVRGPDQWPYSDLRDVEMVLKGQGKWELPGGVTAIHVPGHSRGHLAFLYKSAIFTGDHLALSARLGRLDGLGRYGWNSDVQSESIANSFVIQVRSLFVQISAHLFVKSHKPWRRFLTRIRQLLIEAFKSTFAWYLSMPLWLRTALAVAVLLATAGSSFAVFALLIIPQPLLDWLRARLGVLLNRLGVTRLFTTVWNLLVPESLRHRWHLYLKWTLGRRQVKAARSVHKKVRRNSLEEEP